MSEPDRDALEAPSPELFQLLQQARLDYPSAQEWAVLSAQISTTWGGPGTNTPANTPANTPLDGPGQAATKLGGATGGTPGAALGLGKVAGSLVLVGSIAAGVWHVAGGSSMPPANHGAVAPAPANSPAVPPIQGVTPAPAGQTPVADAAADPATAGSATPAPSGSSTPYSGGATKGSALSADVSELQLLKRARKALAKQPNVTLALCQRHQKLYPQGQLGQEREVLVIAALQRLDRDEEAKQRRKQFEEAFPGSPHTPRVHQVP